MATAYKPIMRVWLISSAGDLMPLIWDTRFRLALEQPHRQQKRWVLVDPETGLRFQAVISTSAAGIFSPESLSRPITSSPPPALLYVIDIVHHHNVLAPQEPFYFLLHDKTAVRAPKQFASVPSLPLVVQTTTMTGADQRSTRHLPAGAFTQFLTPFPGIDATIANDSEASDTPRNKLERRLKRFWGGEISDLLLRDYASSLKSLSDDQVRLLAARLQRFGSDTAAIGWHPPIHLDSGMCHKIAAKHLSAMMQAFCSDREEIGGN